MTMLGEFQIHYKLHFCGGLHCVINFKIQNYFVLGKFKGMSQWQFLFAYITNLQTGVRFLILCNIISLH
jgi:hypothetical protein